MRHDHDDDVRAAERQRREDAKRERRRMRERVPIDRRTRAARRLEELEERFLGEIDGTPSEADRVLARQAATLALEGERLSQAVVRGEAIDHEQATRLTNALSRTLSALRRRAPKVRPKGITAREYAAQRRNGGA